MTREIVSLTPLPVYAIQGARVRYGSKPVRGANAASFEPLLGAWSRDRGSIYFEGRRVGRAQREPFRALGLGYARDASRVIWTGGDRGSKDVVDADLATLTVDVDGARDRHGRFVAGRRAPSALPVETESDRARAARSLIERLWSESLASWFADFDRSIPTDDGIVRVGIAGEVVTPIPEHRLVVIEGARVALEVPGARCVGTVSGLELLGGFLYGFARGKILDEKVCVRVALRTDGEIVSNAGNPPRWQACVDLAYLFEKLGHRLEAALLLQRVAR